MSLPHPQKQHQQQLSLKVFKYGHYVAKDCEFLSVSVDPERVDIINYIVQYCIIFMDAIIHILI